MTDIFGSKKEHGSGVYAKRKFVFVRGQGALLYDSRGREYIDCVGGQGSANLGHAHPAIVAAVTEQARTLIACTEMFYNDRRAELVERLTALVGMPRVFLCNSGTEAVEAALKFARLATGRAEIVGLDLQPAGFPTPAFQGQKNTLLVRAFLAWIRLAGGEPSFVLKTGTTDLNLVAPAWGSPALAYGPGDSSLDHTPEEHLPLKEYRKAVDVLKAVLVRLCKP